jgi:hypothetical protein
MSVEQRERMIRATIIDAVKAKPRSATELQQYFLMRWKATIGEVKSVLNDLCNEGRIRFRVDYPKYGRGPSYTVYIWIPEKAVS